jgi:glycosyltransferase involved in cell wall biosynthesis
VDLAGASTEAELGRDGGIELADPDPIAIADALERLLDDRELWERRSQRGLVQAAQASWDEAGRQVEHHLREALRERERETPAALASGEETGESQ